MSFTSDKTTGPAFLTVEEIAEMTELSVSSIRRAIDRKKLKVHKFGRAVRVRREDLDDYLNASRK